MLSFTVALAGPSSTSYELKNYGFGNGGAVETTSTNYKLNGVLGEVEAGGGSLWYNKDWSYRKKLTIQESQIPGSTALTDFPLLVSITDANLQSSAQSDGDDIVFTDTTGAAKLDHEIETYISGTGTLVAWVRIPSLSATSNTDIYLYYGNTNAGSNQNPQNVWNANYKMVMHLKETPDSNTGTNEMKDSTANVNHGTNDSSMGGSLVSAKINGGIDFVPTDYIKVTDSSSLDTVASTMTVSAWINADTLDAQYRRVVSRASSPDFQWFISNDGSNPGKVRYGTTSVAENTSTATLSTGVWYYLTMTCTNSNITLYINGSQDSQRGGVTTVGTIGDIAIAADANGSSGADGKIDEVRISDTAKSADWIAAEFNNQNSPGTFISSGSQQLSSSVWLGDWLYRKQITIDHTKVMGSSNLTDFPLLISISDTDLSSYAQMDGDDIVFTSSDAKTKLSHEIEDFDSAIGALSAWVKVPVLDYDDNTILFMYYGSANSANQQDADNTWNTNYKGVWHFTGSSNDSTSNNQDLTNVNVSANPGKIATSNDYTGSASYSYKAGVPLTATNNYTLSAWIYSDILPEPNGIVVSNGDEPNGYGFGVANGGCGSGSKLQGAHYGVSCLDSGYTFSSTSTWYQVTQVRDSGTTKWYVNGAQTANTSSSTPSTPANYFSVGSYYNLGVWYYPYDGRVDEVRISNVVRSPDWISTEFNNQDSPSTFYFLGLQEGNSSRSSSESFQLGGGLNFTMQAHVPAAPTVTNTLNYYNKLKLVVNQGNNPSDTKYAIAVSTDDFASDIRYVQDSHVPGSSLGLEDWLPYSGAGSWGGASGIFITGLQFSTTYSFKVAAKQGNYTETGFGPTAQMATYSPEISFDLDVSSSDSESSPPYVMSFGDLTPGSVSTISQKIWIDIYTNGDSGSAVYFYGTNGGLKSSSLNNTMVSSTANLASTQEGFGMRGSSATQSAGGPMQFVSPYNSAGDSVGIVDTQKKIIADSSSTAVFDGRLGIEVKAKSSALTKSASDYGETVTFVAAPGF